MRLGIFAKTFPGSEPAAVLGAARAAGFACVQYNMVCSGLPAMPDAVPAGTARAVAEAAGQTGIAISALSGTYNMIHPDPQVRETGLRRLDGLLAAAAVMGAPLVTLCTGTRNPDDPWRFHPENAGPEAWRDLLGEMARAAGMAESHGVMLGIEPEAGNVVDTAASARRLLSEIASPNLGIVLDPANLIEAAPSEAGDVIARAVDMLGPRIVLAHAKDRDSDGAVVPAGCGLVDFGRFIRDLRVAGFDGDLVAHGLTAAQAPAVARHLSALIAV